MKRIVAWLPILIVFVVAAAGGTIAQTPKRVEFAKGKTSATVKSNTGKNGVTYLVRAKSGQKLVLSLTPVNKVGIKVETDGQYGQQVLLREELGGVYIVGLEESGDYTIFVGSLDHSPIPFTLKITIAKMTDI